MKAPPFAGNISGRITPKQIRRARETAAQLDQKLLEVLAELLNIPVDECVTQLAERLQWIPFDMAQLREATPAFEGLSFTECLQRECIGVRVKGGALIVIMADPFLIGIQSWVEERLGEVPLYGLAKRADILAYLSHHEESLRAMDMVVKGANLAATVMPEFDGLSLKAIAEDTSPVIRLVHSTLYDALRSEASDIHLETSSNFLSIRYRIDGVLTLIGKVQGRELAEQVISRIKVMAELDIAERRVPQDGRLKIVVQRRQIDVRVSIMPSIHGEDAVLRILDKNSLTHNVKGLSLDSLGFEMSDAMRLRQLAREPYGMLLVTGPTGSGKTTTLYAVISEVNDGRDKIVTIEDPVEYELVDTLQIPVNDKKGLTFARGLRSILRHDPDKVMVGEIRDSETAQIAVQAALTGHLVFTTVHANNVFDVIGRFIHMGADPYSFISALNGVLAQRLVRVNCSYCVTEYQPAAELIESSGLDANLSTFTFLKGTGCGQCRGTGYKGRKAIAEILQLNDELRELIVSKSPIRKIKEVACRSGLQQLRDAAVALVKRGESTLDEINRVTFV